MSSFSGYLKRSLGSCNVPLFVKCNHFRVLFRSCVLPLFYFCSVSFLLFIMHHAFFSRIMSYLYYLFMNILLALYFIPGFHNNPHVYCLTPNYVLGVHSVDFSCDFQINTAKLYTASSEGIRSFFYAEGWAI